MLKAKLGEAGLLKKVLDAIKELPHHPCGGSPAYKCFPVQGPQVCKRQQYHADTLNLIYEATYPDHVAKYDMKLMDIDIDALGIPDTEYNARITMPLMEHCPQLVLTGREHAEAANANILLRQSEESGPIGKVKKMKPKEEDDEPSPLKKVKKVSYDHG
ncbi:hypothetical protein AX14_003182 [Amanita brunnescens Koide BX004]|nr:hypothetical protein AX14_003182 [Amanita brunnescens Koide BX004]